MTKNRDLVIQENEGDWKLIPNRIGFKGRSTRVIHTPLRCEVKPIKKIQRGVLVEVIPEDSSIPNFEADMNDAMFFNLVTSQLFSRGIYDGFVEGHVANNTTKLKMSPSANKRLKQ